MGVLERYFALVVTILFMNVCLCLTYVLTPENAIVKRKCKFLSSVVASDNLFMYFVL